MWKRLLVPHDFSACAAAAVELAKSLAKSNGASIELLHVSQLPPNLPPETRVTPDGTASMSIAELTTRAAHQKLEEIATPLRAAGVDTRALAIATASRDVAAEILHVAQERGFDGIVIGTHGRAGLAHLLLGSVAEKVIRGARVPVVTIRSSTRESEPTNEEQIAEDEVSG